MKMRQEAVRNALREFVGEVFEIDEDSLRFVSKEQSYDPQSMGEYVAKLAERYG